MLVDYRVEAWECLSLGGSVQCIYDSSVGAKMGC